jgi:putative transposase
MKRACSALALTRATAYRHLRPLPPRVSHPRRPNHRRLSQAERGVVLELLDSERFIDQPPREVYATLLEEGRFFCSIRTMYRLLRERGELRDRRDHRERGKHAVPRLVATAPNQVWTWDISKLATLVSGIFLNLYVVLDLFSRYVVAWMVAERENSALAQQLFAEAISRYGIEPGKLVVHQDRGAPMTAHGFAELLSALGVDRSYSRPRVSNDNPHQESLFHTAKYQPDYPGRFRDPRHGRHWCQDFFGWYNDDHHHEGLNLFTPADVFFGRVELVAARRQEALEKAFAAHPERFVRGLPRVRLPPNSVAINPVEPDHTPITADRIINARDAELASLWTPAPRPSTTPVIHIPGVHIVSPGVDPPHTLST